MKTVDYHNIVIVLNMVLRHTLYD